MQEFYKPIQIRWADIDANRHLRHSAYYDYGATLRMMFLNERGLTTEKLEEFQIGPILFREEAIFKREIRLEDNIIVNITIVTSTKDFSRWSLRHHFIKADKTLAAILNVDGAWIDIVKRRLAIPNEFIQDIFGSFPKAPEFEWMVSTKK